MSALGGLYYIDGKKNIQIDNQKGVLPTLWRILTSLTGSRNYNIATIFKKTMSDPTSIKQLDEHSINYIKDKAGRKLHLNATLINALFTCIYSLDSQKTDRLSLSKLTQACHSDKAQRTHLDKLKNQLDASSDIYKILAQVAKETELKSKLAKVRLDPQLVDQFPEEIEFLLKTRLLYSLLGYQNSTMEGRLHHELRQALDENGAPCLYIKKQGQYVAVKSLQKEFNWDVKERMLSTPGNSNERWNYFNEGLVPVDRFYHHEVAHRANYPQHNSHLHPIAKLSECEMENLLVHAHAFNPSSPTNNSKDCVIQFVSNPRPPKETGLLRNLSAQIPVHCGIRIVQSNGTVYSTGFGSTLLEDKYNDGFDHFLATINGQPTNMDYEEFRPHQGRVVTSIPVTAAQSAHILNQLNEYRKQSIRFNIIRQNCMKLGTNVLGMAGVDLDIRVSLGANFFRAAPSLEQIPVLGKSLATLSHTIKNLKQTIANKMPEYIKKAFNTLSQIVFFVPNHILFLFKNLLVLSLGGRIGSPLRHQTQKSMIEADRENDIEEENDDSLEDFSHLVQHLLDREVNDIHHSSVFVNWQLQLESTVVHAYSGQPSMNILPPETEDLLKYSENRKATFKNIYQYSIPMAA